MNHLELLSPLSGLILIGKGSFKFEKVNKGSKSRVREAAREIYLEIIEALQHYLAEALTKVPEIGIIQSKPNRKERLKGI